MLSLRHHVVASINTMRPMVVHGCGLALPYSALPAPAAMYNSVQQGAAALVHRL